MATAVQTMLMLFRRNYAKTSIKIIMLSPKWTLLEFRKTVIVVGLLFSGLAYVVLVQVCHPPAACILDTGTQLAKAFREPDARELPQRLGW